MGHKQHNQNSECKSGIKSIIDIDGNHLTDGKDIANCLNRTFYETFNNYTVTETSNRTFLPRTQIQCSINEKLVFNSSNIQTKLITLDKKKSSGIDGISSYVLNECNRSLNTPISLIFKKSFETGKIPQICKKSNITLIPKKGTKTNPSYYRPISTSSAIIKIMERMIKDEMTNHLLINNLIAKDQHGFIKLKSCVTNLLETLDVITEALNIGFYAVIIFLDFEKAFDKVIHSLLL